MFSLEGSYERYVHHIHDHIYIYYTCMYIICMFVCTYMYTDKCTGNDYISIPYRYTYTYIERERERDTYRERDRDVCVSHSSGFHYS